MTEKKKKNSTMRRRNSRFVSDHHLSDYEEDSDLAQHVSTFLLRSITATSSGVAGPAGQREQQRPWKRELTL
eukprot:7363757-Prymnesium_polylepis.1